ncbi:MAG: HD domain-containing protein [Gemmatimonadota bacterium]|nr:HD domain-containing protein [Gemmatimonadota bacterium]
MTGRSAGGSFTVIRDPIWNNIELDSEALAVLDTEPFQRLRYVRQLGHTFLVYPTAHHTRFEHALGTYHLTRRCIRMLDERGELDGVSDEDRTVAQFAGLLHDIGHYPFSHALEETGLPNHEIISLKHFDRPDLKKALDGIGVPNIAKRLGELIAGESNSPLQGLISGSLDLDKLEYLSRDARMCGVPYGTVDVDRLLQAITVVRNDNDELAIAIHEKGISALESLVFGRYQMYRNVYWHHAVRSATAMFKRAVTEAIARNEIDLDTIAFSTDDALVELLAETSQHELVLGLKRRRLYKRLVEISGADVPADAGDWIANNPKLLTKVENHLAAQLGLKPGEILVDFPRKAKMLDVDMLLKTEPGDVVHLGTGQGAIRLGIDRVAEELHSRARNLRVFAKERIEFDPNRIMEIVSRSEQELQAAL